MKTITYYIINIPKKILLSIIILPFAILFGLGGDDGLLVGIFDIWFRPIKFQKEWEDLLGNIRQVPTKIRKRLNSTRKKSSPRDGQNSES